MIFLFVLSDDGQTFFFAFFAASETLTLRLKVVLCGFVFTTEQTVCEVLVSGCKFFCVWVQALLFVR